jgi:ABC-2 type transport system ATP-binding protein/lipopolysaccharide transport system ATP-binding protein
MARAIEIEGLSKHYALGGGAGGYSTLRESLSSLGRRRGNNGQGIWAIRDLDLAVDEGEVVGVIGPNGAGKTTLLKVLTRITEPTTGITRTRGRVGALLEVGTGFHSELTGRENVYLNGAILGMRRREIRRRFDEIVEFAELQDFIDTPVKRYSSGMQMRLAFAVAAHLEPDVLIVDEVLAVGDARFQRKSLGKMDEVAHTGRTVLFVSHNLSAIAQLCHRAVWLDRGKLRNDDGASAVVQSYLESVDERALAPPDSEREGSLPIELRGAEVRDVHDRVMDSPRRDTPFDLVLRFRLLRRVPGLDVALYVLNSKGVHIADEAWSAHPGADAATGDAGDYEARLTLPPVLAAGRYTMLAWIGTTASSGDETFIHREVLSFRLGPRLDDPLPWAERDRLIVAPSGLALRHSSGADAPPKSPFSS